jgi:hypothetical protein
LSSIRTHGCRAPGAGAVLGAAAKMDFKMSFLGMGLIYSVYEREPPSCSSAAQVAHSFLLVSLSLNSPASLAHSHTLKVSHTSLSLSSHLSSAFVSWVVSTARNGGPRPSTQHQHLCHANGLVLFRWKRCDDQHGTMRVAWELGGGKAGLNQLPCDDKDQPCRLDCAGALWLPPALLPEVPTQKRSSQQ